MPCSTPDVMSAAKGIASSSKANPRSLTDDRWSPLTEGHAYASVAWRGQLVSKLLRPTIAARATTIATEYSGYILRDHSPDQAGRTVLSYESRMSTSMTNDRLMSSTRPVIRQQPSPENNKRAAHVPPLPLAVVTDRCGSA